ncbi:PO24 protein, partial [Scytalopus superciliaris]|nr:PO24 protein [Scytalopus superciliaris]
RANVYPTREYLARGRKDGRITSCRHCKAENESCAHIIGQCPARIKRHNYICEMLSVEAKKKDWVIYQEPNIRDPKGELFKPDLVFVKETQALVVDVTVRFEGEANTLEKAAKEKVKKYQHLEKEIRELTNTNKVTFVGFPLGARGKWYNKNFDLLQTLGLSTSRRERVARAMASRALFTSVDIIHIFVSKTR